MEEVVSKLEKCSSDISHKSLESVPQPLEFHRVRKKSVWCAQFTKKQYIYPSLSLSLSHYFNSLIHAVLSLSLTCPLSLSLSSDELAWLIKGRVFKDFSTSNVLFWPENPWQKLHSIFPAHNLCCRSQLIGCQQNNLAEERTPWEGFLILNFSEEMLTWLLFVRHLNPSQSRWQTVLRRYVSVCVCMTMIHCYPTTSTWGIKHTVHFII